MRRLLLALLLTGGVAALGSAPAPAAPAASAPQGATSLDAATRPDEDPSVLPAGPAQEEVFYACTACHSTAIIRRSHFTREQWDGLMDWMTERHGMNALEGEERRQIVDYLAQHFGPRTVPARGRNPFLN